MRATSSHSPLRIVALVLVALGVAAPAGATASTPKVAPLTAHLLRAGDLRGFVPDGPPEVLRDPLAWARRVAPGEAEQEATILRRLGFVGAASVHLRFRGGADRDGLSFAVELRNARAAHAYLLRLVERLSTASSGERVSLLCAIEPLGAFRLDVSSPGSVGTNVVFQRGRVVHLVGVGHAPDAVAPPSTLELSAAASALVRRVGRATQ
jgi:hypothetical protein